MRHRDVFEITPDFTPVGDDALVVLTGRLLGVLHQYFHCFARFGALDVRSGGSGHLQATEQHGQPEEHSVRH